MQYDSDEYFIIGMKMTNKLDLLSVRNPATYELSRGKTNNVVSEQAQHKPVCIVTEAD